MDTPLRVETRKIEFTTYGPGRAPVWSITFALHASTGYEHRFTVIVQGHGHDDVTDVCAKARAELVRICALMGPGTNAELDGAEESAVPEGRGAGRRSRGRP